MPITYLTLYPPPKKTNKQKNQVRAILLDPSCSGSGMVASLERQLDNGNGDESKGKNWRAGVKGGGPTARLKALAQFQYKALTKAFSFPQVHECVNWRGIIN